MTPLVKAAFAYVIPVFVFAFGLGALRVSLIAPLTGPLVAVVIELPLVLAFSWAVASRVLTRWPLTPRRRMAMGGLAFVLLMLAEFVTALVLGQTPAQFLGVLATAPGLLGLAGQIGFGFLPLLVPYSKG